MTAHEVDRSAVSTSLAPQKIIDISDESAVGDARRVGAALASMIDLDEPARGRLAIVINEAARNILLHAGNGSMVIRGLLDGSERGVEVLAIDSGRGMSDVGKCLRDGYSTTGTPGTGLGAITRQSSLFDIFSVGGKGTVVLSRIWNRGVEPKRRLEIGGISIPMRGEEVCGDGWAVAAAENDCAILLSDGLGHGPVAAAATRVAIDTFIKHRRHTPAQLLETEHGLLRPTRGAALLAGRLDLSSMKFVMAGVGNIAGSIWTAGKSRSIVSHNGTVGHEARKIQEFTYDWSHDAALVIHSDGIASHWRLDAYPGLAMRHPSVIAAVLYRDHQRTRDDATVLVVKEKA